MDSIRHPAHQASARGRGRFAGTALLTAIAASPVSAHAASPEEVFERAAPSVVVVERVDRAAERNGFASGVVTATSRVVTSCHALVNTAGAQVRVNGMRLASRLEFVDLERDLCQLEVDGLQVPAVPIVPASQLKVGQRVYAIGTPKGLELTLSEGLISSLRPRSKSFVIQTTAPMSRGSSGGGLFDTEGRLIGISAFQYARGQNLNFAVPAGWVPELPQRAHARWSKAGLAASAAHRLGARWLPLMDIGNFEAALQVAREWVVAEPTGALPRSALGRTYGALKRQEEAVMALRSALKLEPGLTRAWVDLGAAQSALGDPREALHAYDEALRIDGRLAEARRGRGEALTQLARYDEAVAELHSAIDLDPSYAKTWDSLALAHATEGRLDLAAAACRKGLKLNPESALLWYRFGLLQAQRGRGMQAIQAYQETLRLSPTYAAAVYDLGVLYHEQGDQDKARQMYEKLRGLDAESAQEFSIRYLSE